MAGARCRVTELDWLDDPALRVAPKGGAEPEVPAADVAEAPRTITPPGGGVDLTQLPIPPVLDAPFSWLMGPAGSGKTTLARAIVAQRPGVILAATTGIAAVNLGEGTTINALLKYFDTASLRENYLSGLLGGTLGRLWRAGVRQILLDEISMMDAEQLTILTRALGELGGDGYQLDAEISDEIALEEAKTGQRGIKLTLIGDFAQLPPVKAEFAFTSPEWPRYAAAQHRLTQVWRQADGGFRDALMAAREGRPAPVVEFFRPRLAPQLDMAFPGTTIMATNDAVDRFNRLRLDKLVGDSRRFHRTQWGTQRPDWKQIPEVLELKVGALVMVLANEREAVGPDGMPGRLIYANGDLGTVAYLDPDNGRAGITLSRNGRTEDVFLITRQNTIPLEPGRRKQLRAQGLAEERITDDGRFEIIGAVTYLPVRVAYATTVHKSQGLTLDAVQVNTREGFFNTAGLLYVALSRCRTEGGLRIVGTAEGLRTRVKVSAAIRPWV